MLIKHYVPVTPNLGDTAITVATRKIIRRMFPDAEILTFRVHKGYYNTGTHFVDFARFDERLDGMSGVNSATFALGRRPDLVVIGGGPLWGSSSFTRLSLTPGELGDTPVMFLGVGTRSDLTHPNGPEPWDKGLFLTWLRGIRSNLLAASARDAPTCRDMEEAGLRTYMTGCPVLHYVGDEVRPRDSNYFLIVYRYALSMERTGVDRAVGWLRHRGKAVPMARPLYELSRGALRSLRRGLPMTSQYHMNPTVNKRVHPSIIPSYDLIRQLEGVVGAEHLLLVHDYRDVSMLAQVAQGNRLNFVAHYDVDSVVPFYQHAKFVVTYRLHGEMLAATTGTPFFHVMIDRRGADHAETFDPESKYHAWVTDLTAERLLERVSRVLRAPAHDFSEYNARVGQARGQLHELVEHTRLAVGV